MLLMSREEIADFVSLKKGKLCSFFAMKSLISSQFFRKGEKLAILYEEIANFTLLFKKTGKPCPLFVRKSLILLS